MKKKNIWFAVLAAGLMMSMTACGGKSEPADAGKDDKVSDVEYFADQMSKAMNENAEKKAAERESATMVDFMGRSGAWRLKMLRWACVISSVNAAGVLLPFQPAQTVSTAMEGTLPPPPGPTGPPASPARGWLFFGVFIRTASSLQGRPPVSEYQNVEITAFFFPPFSWMLPVLLRRSE